MRDPNRPVRFRWIAVVVALALAVGACGDDSDGDSSSDGASSSGVDSSTTDDGANDTGDDDTGDDDTGDEGSDGATGAGDGSAIAGSLDDDALVAPRDYLQGVWCDGDGGTWTIEGDTATVDDGSDGIGEFPLDLIFAAGVGVELFSQSDDRFTWGSSADQVTFTRGAC